MRLLPSLLLATSALISLAFASPECTNIRDRGIKWNLDALKGPHTVSYVNEEEEGTSTNTTFEFDLCGSLPTHKGDEKDCRSGSWVCAFKRRFDTESRKTNSDVLEAWSIAGTFHASGKATGGQLDDRYERLKGSNSDDVAEKDLEGVRLIYSGGHYEKMRTRFIATLICDEEKNAKLRRREPTSPATNLIKRAAKEEKDDTDEEENEPEFVGYSNQTPRDSKDEYKVLRIRWKTVHACEDHAEKISDNGGGHWGFFTWLIIIVFLAVAAYLIFGSWLNYNRHGARGWDLLPHGDTIRDIPYLMKDWGRAVIDTVQGTRSRGGYNQI